NRTGKTIFRSQYDWANAFSEGLALVGINSQGWAC
ncbi:MAG: hypothetical protein FD167_4303, partial [bacterium]